MALDLRKEFAEAYPEVEHLLDSFGVGSKHPEYNDSDCADSLKKFCSDFLSLAPFKDPRGKEVKIVKGNFTKLVHLEHLTLPREDFPSCEIIKCIENGTFNLEHYAPMELNRMRTLFWIPELITNPDSIYKNGHKIIAGDEVYVRNYDKMGSKVKLLFTMDIKNGKGKYVRTVPVTSFLTDPGMVVNFVSGRPKYRRAETEKPPAKVANCVV